MTSKVEQFLTEVHARSGRKRPAPPSTESAVTRLLPIYLHLDHGAKEAKEQLLWKLGDTGAMPAMVARAFCQQHIQQPQHLEREAPRLQKELEKMVEQHKDLATTPLAPTIVRLDVRITLAHLACLFYDEPLWDLSAPRAACEAYAAMVCNELGLDWHAHTLITRRMKDAIDAATKDLAAGKAQVLALPSGAGIVRDPPSRLPQAVPMTEQQRQQLREHLAAAAAKRNSAAAGGSSSGNGGSAGNNGSGDGQPLSPGVLGLTSPGLAAAPLPAEMKLEDAAAPAADGGGGDVRKSASTAQQEQSMQQQPLQQQQQQGAAMAASPAAGQPSPSGAAAAGAAEALGEAKSEGQEAGADGQPAPASEEPQGSDQTSGQDMPDLPE